MRTTKRFQSSSISLSKLILMVLYARGWLKLHFYKLPPSPQPSGRLEERGTPYSLIPHHRLSYYYYWTPSLRIGRSYPFPGVSVETTWSSHLGTLKTKELRKFALRSFISRKRSESRYSLGKQWCICFWTRQYCLSHIFSALSTRHSTSTLDFFPVRCSNVPLTYCNSLLRFVEFKCNDLSTFKFQTR